jgi:small subunit ribosomal protein S9
MEGTIVISGKRKASVAKVKIRKGKGQVLYNGLPYENLNMFHKLAIMEPIRICEKALSGFDFDLDIRTKGGGKEGQIQAARLGVAKALVKATDSAELKKAFMSYDRHLLVADVRRKEAYKPGDSKARAKRQKSYR